MTITMDKSEITMGDNVVNADLFTGVFNKAQMIILILNTDGTIVDFNPFLLKLTGYTEDEVKGQNWFDMFISKEIKSRLSDVFNYTNNKGETDRVVNDIFSKDGSVLSVEWANISIKDKSGNQQILSLGIDITKRIEYEKLLVDNRNSLEQLVSERTKDLEEVYYSSVESENRYRKLIENLDVGIIIFSKTLIVDKWNQAALDILGFTPEEMTAIDFISNPLTFYSEDGRVLFSEELPFFIASQKKAPVKNIIVGASSRISKNMKWLQ
ncbi:MAG: PAS domain-containing protein, partial [Deltaproteobacteria bacterium]|nr:PAS domain-containing protein [Deltaproteobacteria bacterium]